MKIPRLNYDEAKGVVARNTVHHSKQRPSSITVSVVTTPITRISVGVR